MAALHTVTTSASVIGLTHSSTSNLSHDATQRDVTRCLLLALCAALRSLFVWSAILAGLSHIML